jgi:phosphatidylglycerol:prolipoprotein diacylglycerol transferase
MKPILLKIGSIDVPAYPFMLSLAFITGTLILIGVCKKHHISPYKIFGLVITLQVSSSLGSRLLYAANNYAQFESHLPGVFRLSPGGFDFTGGLFLSIIAAIIFMKFAKLPAWVMLDCSVPALGVGIFLTKTGCFLGGCCYGKETSFFLGVRFPPGSLAAQKFGVMHLVHPTQCYEAVSGLLILAAAIFFVGKHKKFAGQLFLFFMILYLAFRAFNEALRGDAVHNYIFHLSQTQFLNILLIFFAVAIYRIKRQRCSGLEVKEKERNTGNTGSS